MLGFLSLFQVSVCATTMGWIRKPPRINVFGTSWTQRPEIEYCRMRHAREPRPLVLKAFCSLKSS